MEMDDQDSAGERGTKRVRNGKKTAAKANGKQILK